MLNCGVDTLEGHSAGRIGRPRQNSARYAGGGVNVWLCSGAGHVALCGE